MRVVPRLTQPFDDVEVVEEPAIVVRIRLLVRRDPDLRRVMKTFSGLRSRCTTPLSCAAARPAAICIA
jgi:hypothetical protein